MGPERHVGCVSTMKKSGRWYKYATVDKTRSASGSKPDIRGEDVMLGSPLLVRLEAVGPLFT